MRRRAQSRTTCSSSRCSRKAAPISRPRSRATATPERLRLTTFKRRDANSALCRATDPGELGSPRGRRTRLLGSSPTASRCGSRTSSSRRPRRRARPGRAGRALQGLLRGRARRRRRKRRLQQLRLERRLRLARGDAAALVLPVRAADRIGYSQAYMQAVLARYPAYCRALIRQVRGVLRRRLDPRRAREQARRERGRAQRELDRAQNLDDDRILRTYGAVVGAMLRTNYYQRDAGRRRQSLRLVQARSARCSRTCRSRGRSSRSSSTRSASKACTCGRRSRARRHSLVRPARGLPHRGARAS